jgi:hypothetical protein
VQIEEYLHRIFYPKLPYDDVVTGSLLNKKESNPWVADCPDWLPYVADPPAQLTQRG